MDTISSGQGAVSGTRKYGNWFFFCSIMHFVNYESSLFKSKSVNLLVGSRIEILHNCLRHSGDFGANEEKMLLKNRGVVTPKTDKTTSGVNEWTRGYEKMFRELKPQTDIAKWQSGAPCWQPFVYINTGIRTRHNRSRWTSTGLNTC